VASARKRERKKERGKEREREREGTAAAWKSQYPIYEMDCLSCCCPKRRKRMDVYALIENAGRRGRIDDRTTMNTN
jgi:hypothetical protein